MAHQLLSYEAMTAIVTSQLEAMPQPLRILEAGCGRHWGLRLAVPYTLTGIDMDRDALAARSDLHRAVLGDLRTAEFPPHSFDVIYCAYVLEHVSGAEGVLERFHRWLAPGGLLIIKVPDRDSAWGLLARTTPLWMHVLVYRYLMGYRDAGKPGHPPYPTCYDPVISRGGLRRFCERDGLAAPQVYRLCTYSRRPTVLTAAFLVSTLSGWRLAWRHNDLLYIVRNGQAAAGQATGSPQSSSETVARDGVSGATACSLRC